MLKLLQAGGLVMVIASVANFLIGQHRAGGAS